MAGPLAADVKDAERSVMRSCIEEAFWRRSLPAALLTLPPVALYLYRQGGTTRYSRLGFGAILLGASSVGYMGGKLSYILGENCTDKFILQAPDSELGASLLKKREQNLRHSELVKSGRLGGIMEIVREAGVETLDTQEKKVLVECNSRAFWNYSVPSVVASYSLTLLLFRLELLRESRRLASFPRLPKLLLACLAGYLASQWYYLASDDCSARLVIHLPEGRLAKLALGEQEHEVEEEIAQEVEEEVEEYIMPKDDLVDRLNIIKELSR